jgi:ATP-dependent DNA ligase
MIKRSANPTYVAFDLLEAHGVDLRPLPLWQRNARLAAIGKRAELEL